MISTRFWNFRNGSDEIEGKHWLFIRITCKGRALRSGCSVVGAKARPIWQWWRHAVTFLAGAAARGGTAHTPAECGRATLPSVGRRYIFSLNVLPTYVRERKCRHATLPHRSSLSCMHSRSGIHITWVFVRSESVCERPRARFRERSTSRTGFVFMDWVNAST